MKYRLRDIDPVAAPDDERSAIDLDELLSMARRQWRVVALSAFLMACLGVAYAVTAVPIYTGFSSILIDNSNPATTNKEWSLLTGGSSDEAAIISQVELIRSDRIAAKVSEALDLKDNAAFNAEHASPIQNIVSSIRSIINVSGWIRSRPTLKMSPDDIQEEIVGALENGLRVTRVPGSLVLTVEYSSPDPQLANQIAQAYADAYLTDTLDAKYDATRRASEWLQQRIAELRQKALQTDLAVQKFRAEKGLIASDGQLLSEQQLTQINTQLILAKSDTSSAQAKYQRIQSIVDKGDMGAAVAESLSSQVINDLRSKYLEASRKQADISGRLGRNHAQSLRLLGEMGEYKRLMFEELGRIAASYKSNYEVALGRQKDLQSQVAQATGVSADANDSLVQLRELEREADTYKKLYETFLQRYQEAVQQQSFPVIEARIISTPQIPKFPSAPRKPLIVAVSMFIGLLIGSGFGAFREFRDRFFRTGDQIRTTLNIESLGTVPMAKAADTALRHTKKRDVLDSHVVHKQRLLSNYVVDHPLSSFAETLRSAKLAVDLLALQRRPKIIGVVSALPGEGKSIISINFAELLASQGARVLLVDADLRSPGATLEMGRHAEAGLVEVLNGTARAHDLMMHNPETKLAFLPAVVTRRIPHSSELLASEAMDRMLTDLSDEFDYIVFDLPPLGPVVDARAISPKLDSYVFVVEWGKTARSFVKKTLLANSAIADKCAGVILNKVDQGKMKLYQGYGSSEFYNAKYSHYYQE